MNENITRQNFLNVLKKVFAFSGLAVVFGPIVSFFFPAKLEEMPEDAVLVCKVDELPENTSKTVPFGRYPALVINTNQGLRAYSAVCTHFACIVKWEPESGKIYCPCHDAYFDPQNGNVLAGPPPAPLENLTVTIENGEIFVGGNA